MAMKHYLSLVSLVLLGGAACAAEPTTSSFCALVSVKGEEMTELIAIIDKYAVARSLKRGEPSPNGILYAGQAKEFIIDVTFVGLRGAEVAFFPRSQGTVLAEAKAFDDFVSRQVASRFETRRCETVEGYGKGEIYGY